MDRQRCMCALSYWDVATGLDNLKEAFFNYKEKKDSESKFKLLTEIDTLRKRLNFLERDCGVDIAFEKNKLEEILKNKVDLEKGTGEFLVNQKILEKMVGCATGVV